MEVAKEQQKTSAEETVGREGLRRHMCREREGGAAQALQRRERLGEDDGLRAHWFRAFGPGPFETSPLASRGVSESFALPMMDRHGGPIGSRPRPVRVLAPTGEGDFWGAAQQVGVWAERADLLWAIPGGIGLSS